MHLGLNYCQISICHKSFWSCSTVLMLSVRHGCTGQLIFFIRNNKFSRNLSLVKSFAIYFNTSKEDVYHAGNYDLRDRLTMVDVYWMGQRCCRWGVLRCLIRISWFDRALYYTWKLLLFELDLFLLLNSLRLYGAYMHQYPYHNCIR